jgi:GNAT superfamily N-acetyltransferase
MLLIRAMTTADIPAGMRLKEQAGWNQLEADWRRLLELQADGGFVAEWDNVAVGTVTTCRFGPVAWVAMMLVDERHRGRGIGRALLTHALNVLDAQGVRSVRLDATPLGRPLYDSLGFLAEATFTRFQGILPDAGESHEILGTGPRDALERVCALDREVTSTDRGRLLRRLADEHPDALRVVDGTRGVAGFLMARPGSRAIQIGPCVADDRAGPLLLADARTRYARKPVFLDIPATHVAAQELAASWGLAAGRLLTRMGRGPRVAEDLERLWASAGPEKG